MTETLWPPKPKQLLSGSLREKLANLAFDFFVIKEFRAKALTSGCQVYIPYLRCKQEKDGKMV